MNIARGLVSMAHRLSIRSGVVAGVVPVLMLSSISHAWLGGFESADGYQPFLNMVQNYNAGQYGPNGGYGGGPAGITPNSGLWQALAGGFSSGGAISYATGHQWYDRTWVNSGGTMGDLSDQALVLTTGHEGWSGPALKYNYKLDAPDLGGVNPISTGSAVVKMSFWWCAQLAGPEVGGQIADGYFGDEINFIDSSGNVGFKLGLTQRASGDKVTYWDGFSMVESSIVGASSNYDRWDVTLDMANDTFSAAYYKFSTSTSYSLVTNAPMMSAMNDFTDMSFRTSPGVTNSKLVSVDDFTFRTNIPAPAAMSMLIPGLLLAGRRRR